MRQVPRRTTLKPPTDDEDAADYPDAVDEADATSAHPDSEGAAGDSVSDDHTTRQ